MYEPNENGVNVGRIVDDLTPFVDRNLAGQVRLEGNSYDQLQIAVIGSASLLVRRRTLALSQQALVPLPARYPIPLCKI